MIDDPEPTKGAVAEAPAETSVAELVVHPRDLLDDDGAGFEGRVAEALVSRPATLLVHLIAGKELSPTGISVLLKGRVLARRAGARFVIRPSNSAVRGHLVSMGLERLLAG